MITILFRCIIIYALLVLAMRLTGKRQIGELEISELITTLLFSELAAIPITDSDIPILYAVLPIFFLSALEVVITFITSRSPKIRKALAGKPSTVIKNGKIDQRELKKIRMSASELMAQLRIKGIGDPASVQYAFFEEDGQFSVFEKSDSPLSYAVISDGHINRFNMKEVNYSVDKIQKALGKAKIDDVFLMLVTPDGDTNIIYKEE